jgi:uncharacterized protein
MLHSIFALISAYKFFFLLLAGLLAGTVDAIAGGGGLISLPVLILTGLPVHIALGTNKLQASFGTGVAAYNYFKSGLISSATLLNGLVFGFLGTLFGSFLAAALDNKVLLKIIPLLMLVVFFYSLFTPRLGVEERIPKMRENFFYLLFGFFLGFYDGFFGPGTGALWVICLIFFLGYNLVKATAYTKIFNLKSNLIAFAFFGLAHQVDYKVGLTMALGQLFGGKLGSHLALRNGARFIRLFFLGVVLVTVLGLFFYPYAGKTYADQTGHLQK